MSDEDALLAAVAATPADDTPRLVFADWLEEQGQSIRAEFIRVQIEVARVETLERIDRDPHFDLFRRQQELIDNHRPTLLGPLAKLPHDITVEFERGFVSELALRFSPFYKHRERIESTRPLPRVNIRDVTARVRNLLGIRLQEHFSEPYSHLVCSIGTILDRSINERSPSRRGSELEPVLFQRFRWPRLTELDLAGCRLGDTNLARLLRGYAFPVLADLDLSGNDLTDQSVGVLFDSGLVRQLKRLTLWGNPLEDAGAIELAGGWPLHGDRLEMLNLRFTNIGTPGRQALTARFGGRLEPF